MPKHLDRAAREQEIAEACLRVLARGGLALLSVRGVAEEAGIATASLRRAFPTQDALREHCFAYIQERVGRRLAALGGEGRELAAAALAELLPLDADRRLELIAQLHLGTLSLTDTRLGPLSTKLGVGVRGVCASVVEELARHDLLAPAVHDRSAVTDLLHAALDGLALQALLYPEIYPPEVTVARLDSLLDALCRRPA